MPRRILDRDDDLELDLRQGTRAGHIRRHQGSSRPVFGGAAIAFPVPGPDSQHAVVKVWGGSPGTTGRHVRYLTQGKGTDGTDTTLFTAEGYTRDAKAFTQQAVHDPHQYRVVVSLPDPGDFSWRRFVQAWMGQVSRDLKQPVDYVAAVHRDTAHTHVHVVLRGRDRDGQQLILPRRYFTHGLRYRAMLLATAWLGPVAEHERSTHVSLTRELDAAMKDQVHEGKKEDGMEDAPFTESFRSTLQGATRTAIIGGTPVTALDPVAQEVLRHRDFPGLADEVHKRTTQRPHVIGAGISSIVLDIGDERVARIGLGTVKSPVSDPAILQPLEQQQIGGLRLEIFPRVNTTGITEADVHRLRGQLQSRGVAWQDAGTDNAGRLPNGQLVVIDPGGIKQEEGLQMDDQDHDLQPREIDPHPQVPESVASNIPNSSWQQLMQRLDRLLAERSQAREREQGMGM